MRNASTNRGVSSVIGVVLIVSLVIVLSAASAGFVLDVASDLKEPAPSVSETDGELVPDVSGDDDQIVRLTHVAGDTVSVSDIEIVLDATGACGKESRIVNLPTNTLGSNNYEGDDIFDYFSPEDGELEESADGTWKAGETIQFRLASTECGIDSGDTLRVQIVQVRSNTIIVETTLMAS